MAHWRLSRVMKGMISRVGTPVFKPRALTGAGPRRCSAMWIPPTTDRKLKSRVCMCVVRVCCVVCVLCVCVCGVCVVCVCVCLYVFVCTSDGQRTLYNAHSHAQIRFTLLPRISLNIMLFFLPCLLQHNIIH